jgi:hypothetical protein
MIDGEFLDGEEYLIDDLYDMGEGELRAEIEKYAKLARRYPHPTTQHQMSYRYAHLRHGEAMKILEARSK